MGRGHTEANILYVTELRIDSGKKERINKRKQERHEEVSSCERDIFQKWDYATEKEKR